MVGESTAMKTKRDYLREAFQIWCKLYNQPGDDWDVWFERGHWYGETRQWCGIGNSRWTERIAKYVIKFKQEGDTADFYAGIIRKYR